ncbi:hypothetical protein LPJ57_008349, partial [Coemansia sp. RSA 486]
ASFKDIQNTVRFFRAIRNAQSTHDSARDAHAARLTNNFLADCPVTPLNRSSTQPSGETTAAPTAAVSASSSWTRVKKAVDKNGKNSI